MRFDNYDKGAMRAKIEEVQGRAKQRHAQMAAEDGESPEVDESAENGDTTSNK